MKEEMMERKSSLLHKTVTLLLAASITTAYSGITMLPANAATKPSRLSVRSSMMVTTVTPKKLKVKVYPKGSRTTVKYKSSNTSVASVSKTGKVTGKKLGSATIKVYAKGAKGKTLKKKVKVNVVVSKKTSASEVKSYASDKKSSTVLIDARSADAYSGWNVDGAKRGGHLSNAVNFSADWINADYNVNDEGLPAAENKDTRDFLNREIRTNNMTSKKKYIVYDTNGRDAKKVAKYLINKKGFRNVRIYNAKSLTSKSSTKLSSYENYKMYVPDSVVKNISDNLVNGTALNSKAKSIVGDSKNVVILHVEYNANGKYTDDGYKADNDIDWSKSKYTTKGHVPGAIAASTDDFEPEEATDRDTSTNYRLRHTSDDQIDDAKLISLVERYGITKDSCVIVTGPDSTLAVARIAVILKYLGVDNTHIMTGLLKNWKADGYALETKANTAETSDFGADEALDPDWIDTTAEFKEGLEKDDFLGVDSRTPAEWNGLSSGYGYHDLAGRIANTVSSPCGVRWNSSVYYYENPDYTMRSADEIKAIWKKDGLDTSRHMSFFCGSGWRVSVVLWDAKVMGYDDTSIYSDGWQGWSNAGLPYIDKDGKTVHYDSTTQKVVEVK
jgi:3-mercaptopyruvate sulfurtransferase SseA